MIIYMRKEKKETLEGYMPKYQQWFIFNMVRLHDSFSLNCLLKNFTYNHHELLLFTTEKEAVLFQGSR